MNTPEFAILIILSLCLVVSAATYIDSRQRTKDLKEKYAAFYKKNLEK